MTAGHSGRPGWSLVRRAGPVTSVHCPKGHDPVAGFHHFCASVCGHLLGPGDPASLMLMALRTLVFSSDERAAQVLAQHLAEFDLEPILCPTIFSALENVGKVRFDGIIADWSDDPEATFLIKRAKETDLNRKAMVMAVVRGEEEVARAYDAGAKAVLFRPLESGEIREALTKARPFMLERAVAGPGGGNPAVITAQQQANLSRDTDVMPIASPMAQVFAGTPQADPPSFDQEEEKSESENVEGKRSKVPKLALVAALLGLLIPGLRRWFGARERAYQITGDVFSSAMPASERTDWTEE